MRLRLFLFLINVKFVCRNEFRLPSLKCLDNSWDVAIFTSESFEWSFTYSRLEQVLHFMLFQKCVGNTATFGGEFLGRDVCLFIRVLRRVDY